jgi:hypothetical protein
MIVEIWMRDPDKMREAGNHVIEATYVLDAVPRVGDRVRFDDYVGTVTAVAWVVQRNTARVLVDRE